MILLKRKEDCCGCSACVNICPVHCIEMQYDEEGFTYPVIDEKRCLKCSKCNKVCPIENSEILPLDLNIFQQKTYGGYHKDDTLRELSSSGGAFSLFAAEILKNGGKVYGCTLDSDMKAVHLGIDKLDDLILLQGAKYVQSDINNVYKHIKEELENGRKILFVGTPCQAAGLYTFLGKQKHPNLFIIDFICHGVPSTKVFADYIDSEEKRQGSKITKFKFRNKDKGWSQTGLQLGTYLEYQDGNHIRKYPAFRDSYMNGFLNDVYLRPSCYECHFKTPNKLWSDITIGDFWGVDKVTPELNDKKGTSLIIINTKHGQDLWDKVKGEFNYSEVDFRKAIQGNSPYYKSAKRSLRRDKFFEDYYSKGYNYIKRKYMSAFSWAIYKICSILNTMWTMFGQFIKFGIVGLSNTIISLGVYYLCLFVHIHYLTAYTAGFLMSVINSFYWNNKYVFRNKKERSLLMIFVKVLTSYGVSFLFSMLLISFMVEILKVSSTIAPILKMAITIPLNFVLNKVWAFKDKK